MLLNKTLQKWSPFTDKYLTALFSLQLMERFIIDYFDQNPISQVTILSVAMDNQLA